MNPLQHPETKMLTAIVNLLVLLHAVIGVVGVADLIGLTGLTGVSATPTLNLASTKPSAHGGTSVRSLDIFQSEGEVYLASGGNDATVKTWLLSDLIGGTSDPLASIQLNDEIYNLDASDEYTDFPFILTGEGGWNGGPSGDTLRVLHPESDDSLVEIAGYVPGGYNYCVSISPLLANDKVLVASSGYYGDVKIQELDLQTCSSNLAGCAFTDRTDIVTGDRRVDAISFIVGDPLRLARSLSGQIDVFEDNGSGEFVLLETLSHGGKWDNFMDVSADGSKLVSGTDSGGSNMKLWDISSAPPYTLLQEVAAPGDVNSIAFSKDGLFIAVGGGGWISIYDTSDLAGGPLVTEANAHGGSVYSLVFGLESNTSPYTLLSGSSDGSIKVWSFDPNPTTTTSSTTSGTGSTTTTTATILCQGLVDSKGTKFCAPKADTWCPPVGTTVQCDFTCCCKANPGDAAC